MSSGLHEIAVYQATPAAQQQPDRFRQSVLRAAGAGSTNVGGPLTAAGQGALTAAVLAALLAFLRRKAALDERQLEAVLISQARAAGQPQVPTDDLIALEADRARQFAEAQEARLRTALATIVRLPDATQRADRMQAVMVQLERFERQRSEAMFGRAVGALNKSVLKLSSPQGAFWRLSPFVKEHTAGCLVMGERFWPWEILDGLHPPRHAGCPCHLESLMAALAAGWMRAGEIPTLADARAKAHGIVMESEWEMAA